MRPLTSSSEPAPSTIGRVVLRDDDLAGAAEQVERRLVELQPDLFGDDLAAGEDRDVLQHRLAPITEAGRLHRDRVERAADLVDDERGERLAFDVLGDDQQLLARLHDLLEQREQVLHRADLAVVDQDVRLVEHRFLAVGIGHEVRRHEALVELHALDEVELHAERVRLLDGDDAVLADLVDGVGDDLADGGVGRGDRRHLRDLGLVVDVLRLLGDGVDGGLDGLVDAALERHRAGTGGHVAQALTHERLGEHGGGRGAVAGDVVGLGRDLLHELRAHVLERVVELDLAGDRHTVVGDRGRAELLLEDDVAPSRPERDLDRVGQLVDARFEGAARLFVELEDLRHDLYFFTIASTSRALRISRSSPSTVISVPPYFE